MARTRTPARTGSALSGEQIVAGLCHALPWLTSWELGMLGGHLRRIGLRPEDKLTLDGIECEPVTVTVTRTAPAAWSFLSVDRRTRQVRGLHGALIAGPPPTA